MNCNVPLAVADWVCHDSLHYKTCFDCFDNGDERRQPKDAQHTAPVQLSPVFVAQQRFAFRSLLISFSRFLPAYLLSPFFFITALTSLALYVRSSTERASLFEEGGGGRWFRRTRAPGITPTSSTKRSRPSSILPSGRPQTAAVSSCRNHLQEVDDKRQT